MDLLPTPFAEFPYFLQHQAGEDGTSAVGVLLFEIKLYAAVRILRPCRRSRWEYELWGGAKLVQIKS